MEGRGFTLPELKRAMLATCGGFLNSAYLEFWELPLWEIIEAIETVRDLHDGDSPEDKLWNHLAAGKNG